MKEPVFLEVPFGSIRPWDENPRNISNEALDFLAAKLVEKGNFKNLVCWPHSNNGSYPQQDTGQYVTGGGNMRWQAMHHKLRIPPDKKVMISLNFPTTEQERIELSVLDNMQSGFYELQALAEQLYPYKDGLQLKDYKVEIENMEVIDLNEVLARLTDHGGERLPPPVDVGALSRRYGVPPFSVLDTRLGNWLARRHQWLDVGLVSEQGRADELCIQNQAGMNDKQGSTFHTGTSIFDPVLAELMYLWFCPPGGTVLDPFAGGSVRGIVAARLGYKYTGVDLSEQQVEENKKQWPTVAARMGLGAATYPVKVSGKSARQRFEGCSPEYITSRCKGKCCHNGLLKLSDKEAVAMRGLGATVSAEGVMDLPGGRCIFQEPTGLCKIHDNPDRPAACQYSPFTLNDNDTMIIKNRSRMLSCYKDDVPKQPAYKKYRRSIELILGEAEAERVCAELDAGAADVMAHAPADRYHATWQHINFTRTSTGRKPRHMIGEAHAPAWVVGDSCKLEKHIDKGRRFDFVFSCPPYFNLEQYSDNPDDLSNLSWPEFLQRYTTCIKKSLQQLAPNRFAVFVVSEVRSKEGHYCGLVPATIEAFTSVKGVGFYNELVLINQAGTLALRAGRYFNGSRKIGRMHQNVLVFYKGDIAQIKANYPELDLDFEADDGK